MYEQRDYIKENNILYVLYIIIKIYIFIYNYKIYIYKILICEKFFIQ